MHSTTSVVLIAVAGDAEDLPYPASSHDLSAEILHVHVRAQPRVVREVPTIMIRVVINHDWIAVPEPAVDIRKVEWGHAEIEAAYDESAPIAAAKEIAASEDARKAPMLEWTVEVKACVAASRVVSNPATVAVHVRRIRMSGTIDESG